MKSAVQLNRLILKFLSFCHVGIHESSCEGNAKINFLGIIWQRKHATKNHIFHLFGTRKYRLFVFFQHARKDDIFLARKIKKRLSYRMFSMVQERQYFLHQQINEKVILMHIFMILENLILSENDIVPNIVENIFFISISIFTG